MALSQEKFNELVYWVTQSYNAALNSQVEEAAFFLMRGGELFCELRERGGRLGETLLSAVSFTEIPTDYKKMRKEFQNALFNKDLSIKIGSEARKNPGFLPVPSNICPPEQPDNQREAQINQWFQENPTEVQAWLLSNQHCFLDCYRQHAVSYMNKAFNTSYQYTLAPNDKPSLLGHFMDVYVVSTATAFSLFLIAGIMAATLPPVSVVVVTATILGALGGCILANDIVDAGYSFFSRPKVASPTSGETEPSAAPDATDGLPSLGTSTL
jgi:hypothetical protein